MDNAHEIIEQARREVAARRHTTTRGHNDRPWTWSFVALALTLLAGLFLLPIRGLDYRLQMVVHGVCAQAHYVDFGPFRMPLCARNTGIYSGFLGTLLFVLASRRLRAAILPPLTVTLVLVIGALAMVLDGLNSLLLDIGGFHFYTPHNELRVATGLMMGMMLGIFLPYLLNITLGASLRSEQRILGSWLDYVALLLLNIAIYLLVFFGPVWIYYPLALFSVAGIASVLFVANLFVLSMVGGLEGQVRKFRQLARPATFALVLMSGELALLAGLRIWIEQAAMPM